MIGLSLHLAFGILASYSRYPYSKRDNSRSFLDRLPYYWRFRYYKRTRFPKRGSRSIEKQKSRFIGSLSYFPNKLDFLLSLPHRPSKIIHAGAIGAANLMLSLPLARCRSQIAKRTSSWANVDSYTRSASTYRSEIDDMIIPPLTTIGRDFCLSRNADSNYRRSLIASVILQRSADRVPGDCLEERVEQRRQADVRPASCSFIILFFFPFFFPRFIHTHM